MHGIRAAAGSIAAGSAAGGSVAGCSVTAGSVAGGSAALTTCFFYVLTKDDYYCLVNNKCVHQVITAVMRLCLEYGVNGDVDKAIKKFVQKERRANTEWYKLNRSFYDHRSYRSLDSTNLIEITPKVTNIKQDTRDNGHKQLWRLLQDIKKIRNEVMHNTKATYSEHILRRVSVKVNKIIDQVGIVFNIDSSKFDSIVESFQKELHAIQHSQETHEEKITSAIKEIVIKKNYENTVPLIMTSMKFVKLPFSSRKILRSDIFHELEFEDISDQRNPKYAYNDIGNQETVVCTDILSMPNRPNVIIVEGDPGSGKTTILRMIYDEFYKKEDSSKFKQVSSYSIMFSINCRNHENIRSFWQYFETNYRETSGTFPEKYVIKALRKMHMIIAIDAYDEANEASKSLVRDVMHIFASSETVKTLITTRRGFSKGLIEQLDEQAVQYCILNIKPITNICVQQKFIERVIKYVPEIDYGDIMESFKATQNEFNFHFHRPHGLIQYITIFLVYSEKIKEQSQELSLMKLSFKMILKNMTEKMTDVIDNASQSSRAIIKLLGRTCLQLIYNSTYEIDQENFDLLTDECYQMDKKIPVESVLSCVLFQRKLGRTTTTEIREFSHKTQQEYFASKVLTEQLVKTRSGTVLEILRELTREDVQEKCMVR